jgi:hypothetical protein
MTAAIRMIERTAPMMKGVTSFEGLGMKMELIQMSSGSEQFDLPMMESVSSMNLFSSVNKCSAK